MDRVWVNGRIVSTSRSKGLSLAGARGLFETMPCRHGKVFLLDTHLDRLIRSCPVMGLRVPSRRELKRAVLSVVAANRLMDARLRLDFFKTRDGTGVYVGARRYAFPTDAAARKGYAVVLFEGERMVPLARHKVKSLNRCFYDRLSRLAKDRGFDEALFLNSRGDLVEGTRTNIFFIKAGVLSTPQVSCGCLPGVARGEVLRLAAALRVPVQERRISSQELDACDELFVTNSLLGVMPVTRFGKKRLRAGAITDRIRRAYEKVVVKECGLG